MKRLGLACAAAMMLGACGGSGGGGGDGAEDYSAYAGPVASTDVGRGQELYDQVCAGCHSSGPALENIGLTPAHARHQIREGSGRMPALGENRVSAEDLEAVLAYLVSIGAVVDDGGAAEPATGGGEAEPAAEGDPAADTDA